MSQRRSRLAFVVLTRTALAAGAALGLWLYKRWGYRVRSNETDVALIDAPPEADGPGIQHAVEGEGPRFHRRYCVRIQAPTLTPEELMAEIGADISPFVSEEVARFEKTRGHPDRLAPGDEFMVHIRAPWNGPVRVVEVEPTMFRLATLEGHMEAGQIEFRAVLAPPRAAPPEASGEDGPSASEAPGKHDLLFTIESWARSRDAVVDLVYDGVGAGKAAQQLMWTFFCSRVAEACGGKIVGEIEVHTEREAT